MLVIYDILLFLYAVICLPILLAKGKWHAGFSQRVGLLPDDLKVRLQHPRNIWIHAVSVGEVVAIAELIRQIRAKTSGHQIVLSTSTKTGYELAVKKFKDQALVIWAPLDFKQTVKVFTDAIAPKVYVVAETELWPNLFTALSARRVPMILVNGRISDKSYGSYRMIRGLMRRFLPLVNVFCVQSEEDARRMIELGAPPDHVHNVGNVKFDDLPQDKPLDRRRLGFGSEDLIWVAGSTHPGEEEIVLHVFAELFKRHPHLRLIVAPRHVERTAQIVGLIEAKGYKAQKYSQLGSSPRLENAMIVVDTIGHLRALYGLADVVFVGKSFTVPGGHNIIEPAFYAKPVIVGPFMENFRDITAVFKKDGALIQLGEPSQLTKAVTRLLDSPQEREALGWRARAVIDKYTGATARSVEFIIRALNTKT